MAGIIDKVGILTQMAVDKGREVVDVNKLKMEIKSEERTIKSYLLIIGQYVALHDVLRDNDIIVEQLQKIKESDQRIDELKAKLDIIQSRR
ncbi:hypothetical protein [Johnsonella ignava]|uniref:hypothetical protein n=1 Tax=Johnsonella ignava TaxID=43995 RepID=UPI0023F15DC1|nr:hypothetical protein [Johnsonella ignava]